MSGWSRRKAWDVFSLARPGTLLPLSRLRFKRISLRHHTSDFRRCILEEESPYLGAGSGAFALYYHYTTICGFVKPLSYYRLVCVPRYSIYIGVDG